jgi:MYXO-CTERM domain-containing protein
MSSPGTRARCVLPFLGLIACSSSALAATVRSDRPRLFVSNGSGPGTSLATFKTRCSSDAKCQAAITSGSGLFPAIALAAGYLANDDASKCSDAFAQVQSIAGDTPGQPDGHSFISNNGRTMVQLAVVRDWCDPVLAASDKQWLENQMTSYADWYLSYPDLDVYHDDMNNVWNAVGLAGLALKGTSADAKADQYVAAAEQQWKQIILPAIGYAGDWWPEGFTYVQPAVASAAWFATAWTIATDEDLYAFAKQDPASADVFDGYLAFHAYAWRPDNHYAYFGDTSSNKQSIELFSRYLVDLLTTGTGSTLGQALSLEIKQNSQSGYDYAGADGWMPALFYDAAKDSSATPRSTLPTFRWMSKGAGDIAILRSGWAADDTFVMLSCGDYFGAHQHIESGSFQIYRNAPLTGSTGCYDAFDSDHWANYYSQHSVHANTLAIYQPGEFFPTVASLGDKTKNVNDGGQRVLRRNENGTAFPNPDLPSYLQHKTSEPFVETGDISTFEHGDCHDYVLCTETQSYDSPGYATNGNSAKVNEVTRQFVFVRPELLVIFDRVEATDASYDKRFLLHAYGAPVVNGQSFTLDNGPGRLYAETLLPASADVATLTNFQVEGAPHPPSSTNQCDEAGGTRLEISPKQESTRDYFLHVLDAAASTSAATPTSSVSEDAASATVTIDLAGTTTTLSFAKTGDPGGHIKVAEGSNVLCDQDLGANPIPPTGGAGGASGAGGTPGSGGSGANAGNGASSNGGSKATASEDDSGCGCRLGAQPRGPDPFAALALLALALRRRRR